MQTFGLLGTLRVIVVLSEGRGRCLAQNEIAESARIRGFSRGRSGLRCLTRRRVLSYGPGEEETKKEETSYEENDPSSNNKLVEFFRSNRLLASSIEYQPKKPAKSIREDIGSIGCSDGKEQLHDLGSKTQNEDQSEPLPEGRSCEIDTEKQTERKKNDNIRDHLSRSISRRTCKWYHVQTSRLRIEY